MAYQVIPYKVAQAATGTSFAPFLLWLDGILASILGASPSFEVDLVASTALAACTYDNGTLGVGSKLTGNVFGAMASIDGVAPALNKTYLIAGQASTLQNGRYKLTQIGDGSHYFILTRISGSDIAADYLQGAFTGIRAGTINANTSWKQTSADAPTMGTDAITFVRDPLVVTTNTAQTISALKSFSALMLAVWNAGATFVTKFTSLATATRTFTLPDVDMTPAQSGVESGALAPAFTGTASAKAGYVAYPGALAAQAAAGTSTLVVDVAISAVALTLAAQPDVPRKLNVYKTDADSSYAATLTIIGKGPAGEAINEVILLLAIDGSHTYVSVNAFATITSATVSALSGNTGADKIAIGVASALGLPIPSGAASVVVYKEGVGATIASTPVNETAGTVDATARTVIPTTATDGTKALHFWFSYTQTPAGSVASHTHTQV